MTPISDYKLPGVMVRHLMRKHRVTICNLASKFSIAMKRVREVRTNGARGFAASEWHYMITGVWLDLIVQAEEAPTEALAIRPGI